MPSYKHTQPGGENAGKPGGTGQTKAGVKPVDSDAASSQHDELEDKYTNDIDEPGQNVKTNNPNRNLNKPDIDKGKYN
ncbi:hypothetical protein FVR03_03700 [Pontibacter qinzhouensis]|uniref:Uncharacterized protein n=1 Tax=Pontibacter qinzhouensis TaxID=2603253 RepID=A0A5C8KC29_9BACT|nr:hypothetical protein [Pontibacter qinzhouensis]TXK51325.1 hypothetical protein FVR03_03700 [Pontibacter qinzhouensis]